MRPGRESVLIDRRPPPPPRGHPKHRVRVLTQETQIGAPAAALARCRTAP
ncbi:hypothetical protein ACFU53_27120 [Streptomyces sp. NPDC057474]